MSTPSRRSSARHVQVRDRQGLLQGQGQGLRLLQGQGLQAPMLRHMSVSRYQRDGGYVEMENFYIVETIFAPTLSSPYPRPDSLFIPSLFSLILLIW